MGAECRGEEQLSEPLRGGIVVVRLPSKVQQTAILRLEPFRQHLDFRPLTAKLWRVAPAVTTGLSSRTPFGRPSMSRDR